VKLIRHVVPVAGVRNPTEADASRTHRAWKKETFVPSWKLHRKTGFGYGPPHAPRRPAAAVSSTTGPTVCAIQVDPCPDETREPAASLTRRLLVVGRDGFGGSLGSWGIVLVSGFCSVGNWVGCLPLASSGFGLVQNARSDGPTAHPGPATRRRELRQPASRSSAVTIEAFFFSAKRFQSWTPARLSSKVWPTQGPAFVGNARPKADPASVSC